MSIHQPPEVYAKVKELLGIPLDEPIFVLRAQDVFSIKGIQNYRFTVHYGSEIGRPGLYEWETKIDSKINDFINWQRDNREKVKVPD